MFIFAKANLFVILTANLSLKPIRQEFMNDAAANLTDLFLALADKTRLRILNLLVVREISVLNFAGVLQEPQPKISRHLAYLRDAKLVESRRNGKMIYYRLTMPPNHSANHILGEILAKLSEEDQMKKDVERLQQNSVYATDGAQMIGGDKSAETNISANKPELAVFLL